MKTEFPARAIAERLNAALKEPALAELAVSAEQQKQLIDLLGLLYKWNGAYNLTSVRDPYDMFVRHILDSIAVSPYLHGQNIIDVGTGPGLPGLPLSIIHPYKNFVLLDSLGKRISFIRQAAHQLGLKNVTAVQSRVEAYKPEQGFDTVLSRAFASLADMLSWCHHLPSANGRFVALKGQLTEQELAQIQPPFQRIGTHALAIPGLEAARHVVEIIKE